MQKRDIPLQQDQKSAYVNYLRQFFGKTDNRTNNLVNRLLLASLIEARSCERLALFSKHTKDTELADFYHDLIRDEVGHYKLFQRLARQFLDEKIVTEKWQLLLEYEALYMKNAGVVALVHG
jgi:tRNA-(ms[2]io[6]A)-hydroxylase